VHIAKRFCPSACIPITRRVATNNLLECLAPRTLYLQSVARVQFTGI